MALCINIWQPQNVGLYELLIYRQLCTDTVLTLEVLKLRKFFHFTLVSYSHWKAIKIKWCI